VSTEVLPRDNQKYFCAYSYFATVQAIAYSTAFGSTRLPACVQGVEGRAKLGATANQEALAKSQKLSLNDFASSISLYHCCCSTPGAKDSEKIKEEVYDVEVQVDGREAVIIYAELVDSMLSNCVSYTM
jgi:hypothetical protein